MAITKKKAGEIAARVIRAGRLGVGVREVRSGEDMDGYIYASATDVGPSEGWWVVYVARADDGWMIRSSLAVVIAKNDGRVIYTGSLNDEG